MRILNLQISKTHGIRIVENKDGGIDFVKFLVDGHYVSAKSGVPEELLITVPINRRKLVADFINVHVMVEDEAAPKPERS